MQADGKGYSSVKTVRGVLRPAFQMAVDDDYLQKNPFGFQLAAEKMARMELVRDAREEQQKISEKRNQVLLHRKCSEWSEQSIVAHHLWVVGFF